MLKLQKKEKVEETTTKENKAKNLFKLYNTPMSCVCVRENIHH